MKLPENINIGTLVYLIDKKRNKVLLGRKKYGRAMGILNGFGGHLEKGEDFSQCVVRETEEELGVNVKAGDAPSSILDIRKDGSTEVTLIYIYLVNEWKGEPKEMEEMTLEWWGLGDDIPLDQMWPGDKHWFPQVVARDGIVVRMKFKDGEDSPYLVNIIENTFGEDYYKEV